MNPDSIEELGRLLSQAGARISINRRNMAHSTFYDATYHHALIALAFEQASEKVDEQFRIRSAKLRFLKFIAARPVLLPDLLDWLQDRRQRKLDLASQMPRGHVLDRTHDRVVAYLVATGMLEEDGGYLIEGGRYELLRMLAKRLIDDGLFEGERRVFSVLAGKNIPMRVLEGK